MNSISNTASQMFCRSCGYILGKLPSNRCPECGRDFDPANPRTFLAHPRRGALRWILKIVLVLIALTLPFDGYVSYLACQVHQESKAIQILKTGPFLYTFDDTTPPWAKAILRGRAAWLWKRVERIAVNHSDTWYKDGPPDVTDCLAAIGNLKSLRKLDLRRLGRAMTDDHLARLEGLAALQELDLFDTDVTDAGLAHLKGLPALQVLCLRWTYVTDAGLAQLSDLPALQSLDLGETTGTDAGLAQLKRLAGLRSLQLDMTNVTDSGLVQFKNFTALRLLALNSDDVTDAGLAQLKNLTTLQKLYLQDTHVTDAGVAQLKGLTNLQTLFLDNTPVTDAGLAQLKGLTALHWLDLLLTQVTDAGVADIHKVVPGCTIPHSSAH